MPHAEPVDTDVTGTGQASQNAAPHEAVLAPEHLTSPAEAPAGPLQIVVMGVAGSGKTTVAALLAGRIGADFAEGDDFHPAENVAKMSAGHALDDDDRWPWLRGIRDWLAQQAREGRSAVVPCSALKRAYRDLLREAGDVRFVHLTGSYELLAERIQGRAGHFMKPAMLDGQLATLQPLAPDESGFTVDVAPRPAQIVDEIVARLGR